MGFGCYHKRAGRNREIEIFFFKLRDIRKRTVSFHVFMTSFFLKEREDINGGENVFYEIRGES